MSFMLTIRDLKRKIRVFFLGYLVSLIHNMNILLAKLFFISVFAKQQLTLVKKCHSGRHEAP